MAAGAESRSGSTPANRGPHPPVENVETTPKPDIRSTEPINQELASIRCDLDRLTANSENMVGYRKEIDYALERIAAIEKHLGIEKKIAA